MNQSIKHSPNESSETLTVTLPRSKSLYHRYLLLSHLHSNSAQIENLSISRDTRILQNALTADTPVIDFQDAGTPSRFALVYFAVTHQTKTLTGNASLKKRYIADLVHTLQQQGAVIEYLENPGFFPLTLHQGITQSYPIWEIHTQESSQFISAFMLVITALKPIPKLLVNGLLHSWSYIHLSADVLRKWGFTVDISNSEITIEGSPITAMHLDIEIDWGSASFVYLLAIFTKNKFRIIGANRNSLQADYRAVSIFEQLGVNTKFIDNDAIIEYIPSEEVPAEFNGSECIDLIPALASAYAYLQKDITFYGIEKLAVKESNRLERIAFHLGQLGISWEESNAGYHLSGHKLHIPEDFLIQTHHDHRIAMAFAPWASVISNVHIDDSACTEKSFPGYWELLKMCNFELLPS